MSELQKINLREKTKKAIAPALPRVKEYVQSAREIVDIALTGNEEKAKAALPGFNEKFHALEKELEILGGLIREDAVKSTASGSQIKKTANSLNMAALFIAVVLFIFFSLVFRDLERQLKVVINTLSIESQSISETANNLTSAAQDLAASTAQQTTAFQQSATAMEEISATVKATEANSMRLDKNAQMSFTAATNGKVTIEQMLTAMNVINDSNALIMKQTEEGNNRISEIVQVISAIENKTKVINDIVFQTKLLSFNASVEAARAGEQGKGFAVVAEEVGNLAQMSGNAAKEISDMLYSSIKRVEGIVNESKIQAESLAHDGRTKVEQGIEIANKCGLALEEIVLQATSMGSLISEITVAVKEQSQGIVEVSNAMGLLDQTCNQNALTSKENLVSSTELQGQVHKLEDVIESLSGMMTNKSGSVQRVTSLETSYSGLAINLSKAS